MEEKLHSPKNKYSVKVNYLKPLKNVGSVVSFTTNNIEDIDERIKSSWMNGQKEVHVVILENKANYPNFDWEKVADYHLTRRF